MITDTVKAGLKKGEKFIVSENLWSWRKLLKIAGKFIKKFC
jgi:tRNA threonylcarbamoyladenosine modification (KEOPS) complex Cgi121 subunit